MTTGRINQVNIERLTVEFLTRQHSGSCGTPKAQGSAAKRASSQRSQRSRMRSQSRGSKRDPGMESLPELPRPHCEMCGAAECLRPWLDDRCHCKACLGLQKGECESPRMKARRASQPSCESFYASKCMKHQFETRAQTMKSRQPTTKDMLMKHFSKRSRTFEEAAKGDKPLATIKTHASQTTVKRQESEKITPPEGQNAAGRVDGERRAYSCESMTPSVRLNLWITLTPQTRLHEGRTVGSPSLMLDRKQLSLQLPSAAMRSRGSSRGRSSSRRRDAGVDSTPALPRPHCEMCGAAECLRPWLDDRCHCDACLGLEKRECSSPRMRARKASNPTCESFYASKCQRHEFEMQTPVKSRLPTTRVPEKQPPHATLKKEQTLAQMRDENALSTLTTTATIK
ncbi:hypothetical protein BESB_060370 [Besnoitia besnoiti]|uniref:Uncharacterized protein n=1 Tax=Besnoitia besnoiti TaxID=94643 RepID=A0A2A9MIC1_BESBE|nr:hypothetical protein BESB_060370 [Besnoitia besnoiti]PFH35150.1 hypothetical protein BESB_060370 [Besnoitia besnoiti]